MKRLKLSIVLSLLLVSLSSVAGTKVIYGEDNRVDLKDSTDFYQLLGKSTAAMISGSNLSANGDSMTISGPTLKERGMCGSERFAEQITAANCSGFLVGEDLLVTAGHCIKSQADCNKYKWVFDYAYSDSDKGSFNVPKESVYNCKQVIEQSLSRSDMNDYALIKLDRKVADRAPLSFRKEGKIEQGANLVVIGHPTGLPTKVADDATVRKLSGTYFVANLDTYGGNSGSAVFDANTGMVEGILVRGETDYVRDSQRGCRISYVVDQNGGRGEDVTYITNIRALKDL